MPDRLTWLGHATVLVELGGLRVLTDPLLRRRVAHLRRHGRPPPPPERLDAVLISHLHRDHADGPSLRSLPPGLVLAPPGAGAVLRRLGRPDVRELEAGARMALRTGSVVAVHAEHDGARSPLGTSVGALGYVVEHAGRRVYFAGDTAAHAGMRALGPLDAALLPVWGWGPSLGSGHLDPEAAAQVAVEIGAPLVVPIHWATYFPIGFSSRHERLRRPGPDFAAAVHARDPELTVALLAPGDAVDLLPA